MAISGPSRNPSFFKVNFTISRPQKKRKNSPVREEHTQLLAQWALSSAFMVKNAFGKTRIWFGSRFNFIDGLNLNLMLIIEF
jgi:hypothetical protein